jgi:hypothetical protein
MAEDMEAATQALLEKLPAELRAPTEEEREKMKRGEMAESEVAERILARAEPPPAGSGGAAAGSGAEQEQAKAEEEQGQEKRIAELAARIYVLRETMAGQLERLAAETEAAYKALPEEERTAAKKQGLAAESLKRAAELERRSDAEMGGILEQLEAELERSGAGTGTAKEIEAAYAAEKSLKKAQLMNKYS